MARTMTARQRELLALAPDRPGRLPDGVGPFDRTLQALKRRGMIDVFKVDGRYLWQATWEGRKYL